MLSIDFSQTDAFKKLDVKEQLILFSVMQAALELQFAVKNIARKNSKEKFDCYKLDLLHIH